MVFTVLARCMTWLISFLLVKSICEIREASEKLQNKKDITHIGIRTYGLQMKNYTRSGLR